MMNSRFPGMQQQPGLLGARQPMTFGNGLLGMGRRNEDQQAAQFEQMAAPYAQWAQGQLNTVQQMNGMPVQQQPQMDPNMLAQLEELQRQMAAMQNVGRSFDNFNNS